MDQGTAFMSRTLRELYELLGTKSKTTKIGINGWNPSCSLCMRSHKPPQGFPHLSFSMDISVLAMAKRGEGF